MTYWIRVLDDPTELIAQLRISATVTPEGRAWLVTGGAEVLQLGRLRRLGFGRGEPLSEAVDVPAATLQAARRAATDREKAAALDALLGEVDQRLAAATATELK